EVDQPVAVDVLDDRARRAGGHDRVDVRDAAGDRAVAPREPLARPWPRDLGDELPFLRDVHDGPPSGRPSPGIFAGVAPEHRAAVGRCQPLTFRDSSKDPEARSDVAHDTWSMLSDRSS